MIGAGPPLAPTGIMAFVLALVALVYIVIWRRDQEPGMGWLALGMALMALIAATDGQHRPSGLYQRWTPWSLVLAAAFAALAIGLVAYLAVPPRRRRLALAGTLASPLAYAALMAWIGLSDAQIPRSIAQLPVGLAFLAMSLLAAWAARREPGAGHGAVALALLSMPVLAVVIALTQSESASLRIVAFGPLLVLALMLVPASLQRRSRALQAEVARRRAVETDLTALNDRLERAVADRMADLRGLVAGLETSNRSVSQGLRGALGQIGDLASQAEQALRHDDRPQAEGALGQLGEQAERAHRLTLALLALARAGNAPLHRQPVDLLQLVRDLGDEFAADVGQGPAARIEAGADLPSVAADADLLKLALGQLVGIVGKSTPGLPDGCVELAAAHVDSAVEIVVRGRPGGGEPARPDPLPGDGVPQAEPRLDATGLGLRIAQRVAERHGGQLRVEGESGRGVAFILSLPARGVDDGPPAP